jgi:hypothetical protein
MSNALVDFYRCDEQYAVVFNVAPALEASPSYFRFGKDTVCFGRSAVGGQALDAQGAFSDLAPAVTTNSGSVELPFDPDDVARNLRQERYCNNSVGNGKHSFVRNAYYAVRPLLPVSVRKHLQRLQLRGWDRIQFPHWPVDTTIESLFERLLVLAMRARGEDRTPFIWFWPKGFHGCAIMTHDVETSVGRDFCSTLMDVNDSFEIKSSFQIVPEERYSVPGDFVQGIQKRGFEVNIHDLNHDGHLFDEELKFRSRVGKINEYGKQYGCKGFRSAVLYRNEEWFDALRFDYDMSIPNVAHLDPQKGGCCTVFPYFIGEILELPLTTTQDYSLFNILRQYSIELWRKQIDLILARHGLVSFIVHPDYIRDEKSRNVYCALLAYLAELRVAKKIWTALPREVSDWWRQRAKLRLKRAGDEWRITGHGAEMAQVAYAVLADDRIRHEFPDGAGL